MKFEITGFEHLHLHTSVGSLLDGVGNVEEYIPRLKQNNQQFFTVSDHGSLAAIPRQIRACNESNINYVLACELYMNPLQQDTKDSSELVRDMNDEEKRVFNKSYHLLAIAYNEEGYKNLVYLTSNAWINGFYRRPRCSWENLKKHKSGIIFTSCCIAGEVGQAFLEQGEDAAFDVIERYLNIFGENYYLELMFLSFDKLTSYNAFLIKAHEKYNIPFIVTNDVHYADEEDSKIQQVMIMMRTNRTFAELEELKRVDPTADIFEIQDPNLWLKSEEDLNKIYLEKYASIVPLEIYNEAKRNTVRICQKSKNVELDRTIKMPKLENENQTFIDLVWEGFKKKKLPKTKEYLDRIMEECELITRKEIASYFLIQKMMVDEARKICPQILGWGTGGEAVGPGRGSSAGSLVCYCLGITKINPIQHNLLFSRFLSPARAGKSIKLRFTDISPLPIEN